MMAMTADRMSSIQRASRALLVFFIFMTVISIWSTLANLAHPFTPDSRTVAGVVFKGEAITHKIDVLWQVQIVLSAALSLKVLYHLIRLMILNSGGQFFTTQTVAQVRQVGVTFALGLVVWLVGLIGAAPEIAANQEQWTSIMPSFPGGAVMGACLFLFGSGIVDEGRKLREEQDLVV